MATITAPDSLLFEFQAMLQELTAEQKFTCYAITPKGKRCRNSLAKATLNEIKTQISSLINLLKKASDGIEVLLDKISSLVMCKHSHQNEAADKCKTWTERLPTRDIKLSQDGENIGGDVNLDSSTKSVSKVAHLPINLAGQETGTHSNVDLQTRAQATNLESTQASFGLDLDDSGYHSGNEEDSTQNATAPLGALGADELPSSSASNTYTAPRTPQKPPPPTSTDSGISMPFDTIIKESIKSEECPESPLIEKGQSRKKALASSRASKPTETLVQPVSTPVTGTSRHGPPPQTTRVPGSSSTWSPWIQPHKSMKKYIRTSLGPTAMKDGYIYGFLVDGCPFTKVGYAAHRKGEKSLEDSLDKRIKEHEKCGWRNPTKILWYQVPHAHKLEKIIHYHLEVDRKREHKLCKEVDGQKCKHDKHTEWFSTPLPRIHEVIRAWKRWIELKPYVAINGKMCLSPEWQINLERVEIQTSGDDWLEWLYRYAPEPVKLIQEMASGESNIVNEKIGAGNSKMSVTIATTGATGDEEHGGGIPSPKNGQFPRTRLEVKFLASRTCQRVQTL